MRNKYYISLVNEMTAAKFYNYHRNSDQTRSWPCLLLSLDQKYVPPEINVLPLLFFFPIVIFIRFLAKSKSQCHFSQKKDPQKLINVALRFLQTLEYTIFK